MSSIDGKVKFNWQIRLAYWLGRNKKPLLQSEFSDSEIRFLNRLFWHLFNDLFFAIALVGRWQAAYRKAEEAICSVTILIDGPLFQKTGRGELRSQEI